MHNNFSNIYYFIDKLNKKHIKKLNKKIIIIFRNYSKSPNINEIIKIRNFCKKTGHKFIISKYAEIAFKLKLDGFYIPAFYKKFNLKKYIKRKNFIIIGSAHNLKEIRIKEKQGVQQIFLSPLFKTKKAKKSLDIIKFNYLSMQTKKQVIALGGINQKNINKINIIRSYGFASISYINEI